MLANVKNAKHPSSTSEALEALAGSSRPFEQELAVAKEMTPELSPSSAAPEIQAAQKLLAQIAVKIIREKRQKTNE